MSGRVLIVDDEPNVVEAFQRALHDAPFHVEVATTAADAFRHLERGSIDVIVCDEQMPGLRGSELLARVRERFPRTVRVMLTGDDELECAIRAINVAGVFRFLRKPCAEGDLRRAIAEALEASSLGGAPEDALHAAFERALGELWMAAQPIVLAQQRRIFAYELLVRSRSPELPHPGALFDAAERLGRVLDLEARILEHAGEVARRAPEGTFVFVNVHPATLQAPALLRPLDAVASRVVLEITERAALPDTIVQPISELRERGFHLAVDDLGAGYAGLTYVAKMAPDVVKLDMSLVQGVVRSQTHASLVSAVVDACAELNIKVVAEGVETAAVREKLLALGCPLQQGYLFARPAPPFCDAAW